jgi:hypothetical protein
MADIFHFNACPMSHSCRGAGEQVVTLYGKTEDGVIVADWPDVGEHTWTNQWQNQCSVCGDDCLCDVYERALLDVQHLIRNTSISTRAGRQVAYRIWQEIEDMQAPLVELYERKRAAMVSRHAGAAT